MAENSIKTMDATAAEQQLKNLKTLMSDVVNNNEIKSIVKSYFNKNTNKSDVINFLTEKYELDENVVKQYLNALQQNASKKLRSIDELKKINDELKYDLKQAVNNVNKNFALKILFPFILRKDAAEQFNIQHELFLNTYKQLVKQYEIDKGVNSYTQNFLNNLKNILNDEELTAEEKTEIIDKNASLQLLNLKTENPEALDYTHALLQNYKNKLETEIFKDTEQQMLLLTEKVNKKELNNKDIDSFELYCAYQIYMCEGKKQNEFTTKLNIAQDAEASGFSNKLAYNLMRELFPHLTKEEYAKLATLTYLSQNFYKNADVNKTLNSENVNEKEATRLFEKYVKNDKNVEGFYKNTLNSVYNMDTSELNFSKKVKNKFNKNEVEI